MLFTLKQILDKSNRDGDVAQLVEHRTGTLPTQVRFPCAARDFSPRVNFQCRLSQGVRTPPCAIACISICVHVKNHVVHARVRWIMETLKHLACTVGWVARLCRSWLSPGKATRFPMGEIPMGGYSCKKKKKKYVPESQIHTNIQKNSMRIMLFIHMLQSHTAQILR